MGPSGAPNGRGPLVLALTLPYVRYATDLGPHFACNFPLISPLLYDNSLKSELLFKCLVYSFFKLSNDACDYCYRLSEFESLRFYITI